MRSCNRSQGMICTEERESISLIKRRKRRSKGVHSETDEEGVYKTVKIATNSTGILCREKRWKEKDGTRLLIFE